MSNFHFDYNNIRKQVAIADLTNEQFQDLFSLLRAKKSRRSQLTREERAFFQCCREHRSYSNNEAFDTVVGPRRGSIMVIKNGTRNSRQRYFCKDVKRHLEIQMAQLPFAPNYSQQCMV